MHKLVKANKSVQFIRGNSKTERNVQSETDPPLSILSDSKAPTAD